MNPNMQWVELLSYYLLFWGGYLIGIELLVSWLKRKRGVEVPFGRLSLVSILGIAAVWSLVLIAVTMAILAWDAGAWR